MKQDQKSSGQNARNKGAQNQRRKRTANRLEEQLKKGLKQDHETKLMIPLTEKDIERIKKEISTLNSRITN